MRAVVNLILLGGVLSAQQTQQNITPAAPAPASAPATTAAPATAANAGGQKTTVSVKGEQVWTDTGIDLTAGETLKVTADGALEFAPGKNGAKNIAKPQGLGRSWRDLVKTVPVNSAGKGALVGRVGEGLPFLVGPQWQGQAPISGRLWLGLNLSEGERGDGGFTATVERLSPAPAVDTSKINITSVTQEQLDKIDTRVQDPAGTPGDRVNFIVVGSEKRVLEGLKNAGWVTVDKDVKSAVLTAGIATLSRQAYLTMPMSLLMLFGRTQDFGFAQGDPLKVVASRHHFRLWKAPFDAGGATVWVGAGTHDIGFDRDQRNNNVTHKIDPDTDLEREHIIRTLQSTGLVAKVEYLTPGKPVTKAKTAHGEEFYSDGRVAIIYLLPDTHAAGSAPGANSIFR